MCRNEYAKFFSRSHDALSRAAINGSLNFSRSFLRFNKILLQLCVTRREWLMTETPSIRAAVQRSENKRKNTFLNY
jgi:hypothetical protein